jgi:hypothetical protein
MDVRQVITLSILSYVCALIWSKDPIAYIKSLEKNYILKSVGIPKDYLVGNVESPGGWKNQGLGLAFSEKT